MVTALTIALLLASKTAPQPGDAIAPFTVRRTDGSPYHWSPGKVAVVSFCAFWCDTWKQQIPRVEKAKRSLQTLPIDFLNVSVDGRWLDKARGAPGLVLSDEGGAWTDALGIDRVPYTLVLDRRGVVRWARFGIVRSQDLVREAQSAFEPAKQGTVYLAFDDFPWKTGNDELLDLLRAEGVHATFFCIGRNLEANARVVRRAAREGHSLQMHSWNHDADNPDLVRSKAALIKLTGVEPMLYRPPGTESILGPDGKRLKLPVSDPYDFLDMPADELIRRLALSAKPGGVLQLHGGLPTTLPLVKGIVENMRKRSFRFDLLR